MKFQRVAFVSDVHIEEEMDPEAWEFTLKLLRIIKPTGIFWGGDIGDGHSLSAHAKKQVDCDSLQREFDAFKREMGRAVDAAPGSWHKIIPGNHENRVERYLLSRAPELVGLGVLSVDKLFGYDDLGLEQVEAPYRIGSLFFLHGHEVKVNGGVNPARVLALKVNDSAIMGHVHRFTMSHKNSLSGKLYRCYTNGTLATLNPSYLETPDWAQGFTLVDFVPSGMFQVQQVIFWREGGELMTIVDGQLYREKEAEVTPIGVGRPRGAKDRRARRRKRA